MRIQKVRKGLLLLCCAGIALLGGCQKEEVNKPAVPPSLPAGSVWARAADQAQGSMISQFWNPANYLNANNAGNQYCHYWWNAHALDVLVDAYNRTQDPKYRSRMTNLVNGVREHKGGTLRNEYYDDMEWMALACLRAYAATGDNVFKQHALQLYSWIITGWSEVNHGGIAWVTSQPASKNACSNAPAAILAARLYQLNKDPQYLEWAIRIYEWQKQYLVDPATGLVWDSYGNHNKGWRFTYNQGTYIGAGLELFRITGEEKYLTEAKRTASYVVQDQAGYSPAGILKSEGTGDGGLFKGIFVRYLSLLTQEQALDAPTRQLYGQYLLANGRSLWDRATRKLEVVFHPDWKTLPGSKNCDASVHLSGLMLLEALDELNRLKLLPE